MRDLSASKDIFIVRYIPEDPEFATEFDYDLGEKGLDYFIVSLKFK